MKLPSPPEDINERPEVDAFLLGFAMCLKAVNKFVVGNEERDKELFKEMKQLAKELFPDHEPPIGRNIHTIRVTK